MSYAGYGQPQYRPEPKVRFDAIGEAWGMVREKMGVWLVAMLLYMAITLVFLGVIGAVLYFAGLIQMPTPGNPQGVSLVARVIINVLSLIISAFFSGGLYRMALKQARGQNIEVSDLFSATDVIGPVIGTQLVYNIAAYIGTLLCIVPGLIVSGRGMFAMPLSVDRGKSGFGALQESWEALKDDTLNAVLFILVFWAILAISIIPCGLGLLLTVPMYHLAVAILYRDFFDTEGTGSNGPTLNMPLPPQSGYGAGRAGDMPGSVPLPPPGRFGDVPPTPGQTPPGQVPPGQAPPRQAPPQSPGQMGSIDL